MEEEEEEEKEEEEIEIFCKLLLGMIQVVGARIDWVPFAKPKFYFNNTSNLFLQQTVGYSIGERFSFGEHCG